MKKRILTLTIMLAAVAFIAAFSCPAAAKVTGVCSDCHTMHSSQSPAPSEWTDKGWTAGQDPNVAMLVTGCVGCHMAPAGEQNTGSNTVPYVHQANDPSYDATGTTGNTLAGGTFYHVAAGADAKGHNVAGINAAADAQLGNEPPGYDSTLGSGLGLPSGAWGTNRLQCAGAYGCHGAHSDPDPFAAISGAHHGDDSTIDGTTVAKSYRFLKGILGKEYNTDGHKWEYKPTASAHNQYKGKDRVDDTYSGTTDTISYLCAQCHGFFHSSDNNTGDLGVGGVDNGTWGNWVRHPTDYDMGNTDDGSEYKNYNGGGVNVNYSVIAPVASVDVSSVKSTVKFADDTIVTCVSCHRAHGTSWNDLLRWNYSTISAGGGASNAGCFICHTTKDDA